MSRLPDWAYRIIGRYSVTAFNRRLHVPLYRLTGGRWVFGRVLGAEMVVLTTRGASSGKDRSVVLFAYPDGEGLVVVGSRGGSRRLPAWYRNLVAHPGATVERGRRRMPVRARMADGDEYDRLWALVNAGYAGYDVYQEVTAHRIPLVVLEPAP